MLLIFVEKITERLKYTLDFVFNERGIDYQITDDKYFFNDSNSEKLNYSDVYIEYVLYVRPSPVLFEEGISNYGLYTGIFEDTDCLIFNRVIDPLSSIFYVLSRMEEYDPLYLDHHNRFESKNSVQNRFNWLNKAICDRWAEAFIKFLKRNELKIGDPKRIKSSINPTFDIDIAYSFKEKSNYRNKLSTFKDYLKGDKQNISNRKNTLKGNIRDPYDTYHKIYSIIDRGFKTNLFWLLGDYGKYDKNIHFKNHSQKQLIRLISSKTNIGIHPSYKSNTYEFYLLNEKERLEEILNKKVTHTRQHYLKLKFPETYGNLESIGLLHDYTMGYADKVGFRSGTARAHKWFDLSRNRISKLTIHPFMYMDGTLNEYEKLSIEESKELISMLYKEVELFGGVFSFIWHNSTIGGVGIWKNWEEVLEHTLNLNKNNES